MKKILALLGSILFVIIAAISAYFGVDISSAIPTPVEVPGGIDVPDIEPDVALTPGAISHDWYEIYFTDPTCPLEEERVGGLDEVIAAEIRAAQQQIDIAAFDLDAEPIVQALIDKRAEGLTVRVVTDSDNGDLSSIRRLRRHGISVPEDKRRGLMHNKFIVIDGRVVWTGSLNFTTNGIYCNNNNLIRIESPRLATNYLVEMDEMYVDRLFGPASPENTPRTDLMIGGIRVENYFAPETEPAATVARTVARAQEEILFMAFSFTDDVVGEAVLGRADAGVPIRGVFEKVGAENSFSYYPLMKILNSPNVDVRLDGNPNIMHHKVFIIDRETVLLGSYNFSDSANSKNDENIIVIHDPTFASYFVDEFAAVWAESVAASQE